MQEKPPTTTTRGTDIRSKSGSRSSTATKMQPSLASLTVVLIAMSVSAAFRSGTATQTAAPAGVFGAYFIILGGGGLGHLVGNCFECYLTSNRTLFEVCVSSCLNFTVVLLDFHFCPIWCANAMLYEMRKMTRKWLRLLYHPIYSISRQSRSESSLVDFNNTFKRVRTKNDKSQ